MKIFKITQQIQEIEHPEKAYEKAYKEILDKDLDVKLNPTQFGLTQEQATEIETNVEKEDTDSEPDIIENDNNDVEDHQSIIFNILAQDYHYLINPTDPNNTFYRKQEIINNMRGTLWHANPNISQTLKDEQIIEIAKDCYNRKKEIINKYKKK